MTTYETTLEGLPAVLEGIKSKYEREASKFKDHGKDWGNNLMQTVRAMISAAAPSRTGRLKASYQVIETDEGLVVQSQRGKFPTLSNLKDKLIAWAGKKTYPGTGSFVMALNYIQSRIAQFNNYFMAKLQ